MPRLKLAKTEADRLPFAAKGQALYFDAELRGFGLLISKNSKSYVAQKDIFGKTHRINIGRHGTGQPKWPVSRPKSS